MPTPKKYETEAEKHRAYRERKAAARLAELQQKGLPPVPPIATMPGTARWKALHEQAVKALETIRDEMQSYSEERSEQWQESERGEEFAARLEALEEMLSSLSDLME
jgi:hypothetical protein